MSAGIAKEFKSWFPALRGLWHHKRQVGEAVLVVDSRRLIFNLITKCRYWEKLTYTSLESTLTLLRRQCDKLTVCQLAMPVILCGVDQLSWTKVRAKIRNIFQSS